jgi:uncharacterized damage-inducible protein DinB
MSSPSLVRDALKVVVLRDLRSLDAQVAAYPDDESLWKLVPGIGNAGGNLALHLAGNLRHFIGAQLGGTGYVRNRDAEFATKGLTRSEIREIVRAATDEIGASLDKVDDAVLSRPFPLLIAERRVRTGEFLIHLAAHFTYHLGQLDYHRRILTDNPTPVVNLSVKELTAIE